MLPESFPELRTKRFWLDQIAHTDKRKVEGFVLVEREHAGEN